MRDSELLSDVPHEFKKLYNRVYNPELQSSILGSVNNAEEAQLQDDAEELRTKYFRSKWDFYVRTKLDELKVSQRRVEELAAYHGGEHGKDA